LRNDITIHRLDLGYEDLNKTLLKNHLLPAKLFIKIFLQEIHAYFSLIFFFAWNSFDFRYKI